MLNEVEEIEDDDVDAAEDAGGSRDNDLMKCLKCDQYVNKTEVLHPVMMSFTSEANILLLFHDACYKRCTSEEVERLVRDAKYLHILHDTEEDDLGHC